MTPASESLREQVEKRIAELEKRIAEGLKDFEAKKYPNFQHLIVNGIACQTAIKQELEQVLTLIDEKAKELEAMRPTRDDQLENPLLTLGERVSFDIAIAALVGNNNNQKEQEKEAEV